MYGSYMEGYYFGRFIAGALIGGIIPFIIFAVKKRWGFAFLSLLLCGLASFIHSIASIVAGVIFIICAIKASATKDCSATGLCGAAEAV